MIAALLLVAGACEAEATLPAGLAITFATVEPLSSKTNVKGDMVPLVTAYDVLVDGRIVVASGTPAMAQVSDARKKGAMGMTGMLAVRPLYLRAGKTFVRLMGETAEKGSLPGGTLVGFVLSPGFTGRSARIPAGTPVRALVERSTRIVYEGPCPPPK